MSAEPVAPPRGRHAKPDPDPTAPGPPDGALDGPDVRPRTSSTAPRTVPDTEDGPPAAAPGEEIAPGYTVVRHLRRGEDYDTYDAWSSVHHCHTVVKTIRPDRTDVPRTRRGLLREAKLLRSLRHPYIVRLLELTGERGPDPALVLESLPGGTLADAIATYGRFPEPALAHLGQQLGAALRYLHEQGKVHCDVKPSNVVVSAGVTRLIDLALARAPGIAPAEVGSCRYMAPEQVLGEEVTAATDVWALGVVLHEAATGIRPFPDGVLDRDATGSHSISRTDSANAALGRVYPQLVRPAPRLRSRRRLPVRAASVLDGCLLRDPAARPALGEIHAALDALL